MTLNLRNKMEKAKKLILKEFINKRGPTDITVDDVHIYNLVRTDENAIIAWGYFKNTKDSSHFFAFVHNGKSVENFMVNDINDGAFAKLMFLEYFFRFVEGY